MKTSSFRRPRHTFARGAGAAALLVVLVLALLALLRFVFPGTLTSIAAPIAALGTQASARLALPESAAALRAERDELRAQIAALEERNRVLEAQIADLSLLPGEASRIAAGVLLRPPMTPYDVLVVGAGSRDGVRPGALAYGPGGTPAGTVSEVSVSNARIALFSATGRTTEGWLGEERIPISLVGHGSGAFGATVAADVAAAEGDVVYLPGPGAIPVGTVVRIETHSAAPTKSLRIRPLMNPFMLTYVEIAQDAL